ncbi:hypothetical protein WN943_000917 [Citrus x changshan-huyou]
MVRSSNLTLSFSSQTSIEEELKRESTADVVTIVPSASQASCLVMFAYISGALGDTPHLSSFYIASKVLLDLPRVILIMFSVLWICWIFQCLWS